MSLKYESGVCIRLVSSVYKELIYLQCLGYASCLQSIQVQLPVHQLHYRSIRLAPHTSCIIGIALHIQLRVSHVMIVFYKIIIYRLDAWIQ